MRTGILHVAGDTYHYAAWPNTSFLHGRIRYLKRAFTNEWRFGSFGFSFPLRRYRHEYLSSPPCHVLVSWKGRS